MTSATVRRRQLTQGAGFVTHHGLSRNPPHVIVGSRDGTLDQQRYAPPMAKRPRVYIKCMTDNELRSLIAEASRRQRWNAGRIL
jgi:hypothetical protein